MNTRHLLPLLALAAILPLGQAAAAVPPVEKTGSAALTNCPTTLLVPTIYHFDKVVFSISASTAGVVLQAAIAADQAALNALPRNTELDIKIKDNPRAVADLKSKVLTFLGAAPTVANKSLIRIIQVTYETVLCPKAP